MALTIFRWAALCVVGFFIAAAVIIHEPKSMIDWWVRDDVMVQRTKLNLRRELAEGHVANTAERLYLVRLRDSIGHALGSRRVGAPAIDPAFSPRLRADIEAMIVRASANHHGASNSDMVVVLDTAATIRGVARRRHYVGLVTVDYVLPASGSPDKCLAIVRVKSIGENATVRRALHSELSSDMTSGRLWGPCAYYDAFGHPGRGTGAWLTRGGWVFALFDPNDTTPSRWALTRMHQHEIYDYPVFQFLSLDAAACAGGTRERCAAPFVGGPGKSWEARVWNANIVSTWEFSPYVSAGRWWWWNAPPLGPLEWTVMSDMAHSIGSVRFRALWQSDREPVEAFHDATGENLDAWLQSWIRRTYGPQTNGPTLSASAGTAGLLALVLGILMAIAVARRRTTA